MLVGPGAEERPHLLLMEHHPLYLTCTCSPGPEVASGVSGALGKGEVLRWVTRRAHPQAEWTLDAAAAVGTR